MIPPRTWDPLLVSGTHTSGTRIFRASYGSGMGIVRERGPNIGGPRKSLPLRVLE